MNVSARLAQHPDLSVLMSLYRDLEAEMTALHPMWPKADGMAEPLGESFEQVLDDPAAVVVMGLIEGYPFGFMIGRREPLLPQADGEEVGSIRFVFVEEGARQVSVGEEMLRLVMSELSAQGVTRFDAHVLPGHRLVKNFFESGGFSARSIVMHHDPTR